MLSDGVCVGCVDGNLLGCEEGWPDMEGAILGVRLGSADMVG